MSKFILLLAISLTANLAWSSDLTTLKSAAQKLNCQAGLAAGEGSLMVCFRNDVLDEGKETETKGCAVRLYDLNDEKFVEIGHGQEAADIILAPKSCQNGGIETVLKWPVDESSTLEKYLISAFTRAKRVIDVTQTSSTITALVEKIQKLNESLPPAAAGAPMPPGNREVPPARGRVNGKHATMQVYYGTDRQFSPNKPPAETFGEARAEKEKVSLGFVEVSIPVNHKYGNIELPSVFNIMMTPDPDEYIVVKSITQLNSDVFFKSLASRVSRSPKKDMFVFIHGYNNTFEEAAQRTAQLAFDLKFPGASVFYSWPSETLLRYAIAEKNVEWSLQHLTQFLREISQKSGATEIHLIAHSMGNRALTNALSIFAQTKSLRPQTFKNVIFAAPDVDQTAFRKIEPAVRSMTKNLTLYSSNNDKALAISSRLHDAPRLGQAGLSTYVSKQFDTVDASAVDSSMLGHAYYGDNPSVVDDIVKVVMESLPVYRRSLTVQTKQSGELFWQIPDPATKQRISSGKVE